MVAEHSDRVTDLAAHRSRLLGPIQLVRRHATSKGTPRAVLNVIASYADADTLLARPGRARLERETGFSRSTVRRAVRILEALGELDTVEEGHGDRATTYRITVSPPVSNPVDKRPYPNGKRVHSEPGEGSQRPRGRVHSDPLPRDTETYRGGGDFPDHCSTHRTTETPPPCRGCARTREANTAARSAAAKASADADRARRLEEQRIEAERLAAQASAPPSWFREARRGTMTEPTRPGTVGDDERIHE